MKTFTKRNGVPIYGKLLFSVLELSLLPFYPSDCLIGFLYIERGRRDDLCNAGAASVLYNRKRCHTSKEKLSPLPGSTVPPRGRAVMLEGFLLRASAFLDKGTSPDGTGLGDKGAPKLPEGHLPTQPSQKTLRVMSARRREEGGCEHTPSEAHRRIWQSPSRRESGNVEGISLRTGKWRRVGKRNARGLPGVRAPRPDEGPGDGPSAGGWESRPSPAGATSHSQPRTRTAGSAKPAPRLPPASAPPGGEPAAPPPPGAETLRL